MNPSNQDPYMILSLSPGAEEKKIKKAYRRLAMKFHPDRNQDDPEAEKKFKQLQRDYRRLRKHKRPQDLTPGDDVHWRHFADSDDPFLNFLIAVWSHYLKNKEGK